MSTCPNCGRQFNPWRGKKFCSGSCRRAAENRRLRGSKKASGYYPTGQAKTPDPDSNEINDLARGVRGYEPWRKLLFWKAVNEVTWKCSAKEDGPAAAWAMRLEEGLNWHGWFGRLRDEDGDWSFGPSTLHRCREAVEAQLRNEPFNKQEGERRWRGNCNRLVHL